MGEPFAAGYGRSTFKRWDQLFPDIRLTAGVNARGESVQVRFRNDSSLTLRVLAVVLFETTGIDNDFTPLVVVPCDRTWAPGVTIAGGLLLNSALYRVDD